jgi:hypothetical protein
MVEARTLVASYAQEVGRLQRELAALAGKHSMMFDTLKELLPDFGNKLAEVRNAEERKLREGVDQGAQMFLEQHRKKHG